MSMPRGPAVVVLQDDLDIARGGCGVAKERSGHEISVSHIVVAAAG